MQKQMPTNHSPTPNGPRPVVQPTPAQFRADERGNPAYRAVSSPRYPHTYVAEVRQDDAGVAVLTIARPRLTTEPGRGNWVTLLEAAADEFPAGTDLYRELDALTAQWIARRYEPPE